MELNKFENDWLLESIREFPRYNTYLEKGFHLFRACAEVEPTHLIRSIKTFTGTKIFISCNEFTPIEKIVKKFLPVADLIILTIAPSFPSCFPYENRKLLPYRDFNNNVMSIGYEDAVSKGSFNVNMRVVYKLSALFDATPRLVSDNVVTFLPLISSFARWDHPALNAPDLPYPYIAPHEPELTIRDGRTFYSIGKGDSRYAHLEKDRQILLQAAFDLCQERLAAECFGAAHVNANSFTKPFMNDLDIGKNQTDNSWGQAVLQVKFPAIDSLPISEILALRREIPEAFSSFSKLIIQELKSSKVNDQDFKSQITSFSERINENAELLKNQLQELLAKNKELTQKIFAKSTMFYLGSSGSFGKLSSLLAFLLGGGIVWDLFDFIKSYRKTYPRIYEDSFFFAAQLMLQEEELHNRQSITRLNL